MNCPCSFPVSIVLSPLITLAGSSAWEACAAMATLTMDATNAVGTPCPDTSAMSMPNEMGVPPALPGRQSNFENSGSIPPAVAFVFAEARCLASLVPLQLLLLFTGCDQAPLRGQQP